MLEGRLRYGMHLPKYTLLGSFEDLYQGVLPILGLGMYVLTINLRGNLVTNLA